tara:strand:- start:3960 stop:4364 length:405 start_codon:yes stop_codon:yes gene_type:complete
LDPRKKLREVLFSIHPLSYRIRQLGLDKETMNKKLFVEILKQLRKIEDRRDFMAEEIGMDMTTYEDQFFRVIEDLMKMCFNKEQLALIQMYLYQLVPDKEWDGTITVSNNKSKKDEVVPFKTPNDVWNVINKFD